MQSRFAGHRHICMTDVLVWQNWHALAAGRPALLESTGAMEGHTATGKRACCRLANTWQNNLAGMPWCPERLGLIMFITI